MQQFYQRIMNAWRRGINDYHNQINLKRLMFLIKELKKDYTDASCHILTVVVTKWVRELIDEEETGRLWKQFKELVVGQHPLDVNYFYWTLVYRCYRHVSKLFHFVIFSLCWLQHTWSLAEDITETYLVLLLTKIESCRFLNVKYLIEIKNLYP